MAENIGLLIWGQLTILLGVLGNVFVLYATVVHKAIKLDEMSIWIINNLAVADLGNCIFLVVPNMVNIYTGGKWVFGSDLCYAHAVSRLSFLVANMVLVNLLSFNKLRRCIDPLRNLDPSKRQKVLVTVITLLFSILPTLWIAIGLSRDFLELQHEGMFTFSAAGACQTTPKEGTGLTTIRLVLLAVCTVLPCLTLMITTTVLMVYAIRKTNRPINKKNITVVILVTASFLFSFLPFFLYQAVSYGLSRESDKAYLGRNFEWVKYFTYVSSWSNPVIYLVMNERFREFTKSKVSVRATRSSE